MQLVAITISLLCDLFRLPRRYSSGPQGRAQLRACISLLVHVADPILDGRPRAFHCAVLPFVFCNTDRCAAMTGGPAEARELSAKAADAWIFRAQRRPQSSRSFQLAGCGRKKEHVGRRAVHPRDFYVMESEIQTQLRAVVNQVIHDRGPHDGRARYREDGVAADLESPRSLPILVGGGTDPAARLDNAPIEDGEQFSP